MLLHPRARAMLALALPAMTVGVASALILLVVAVASNLLQHFLWQVAPPAFGATADTWWWILGMLTATGFVVGLIVHYVPGHAGPDPATVSLFGAPLPLAVLPGLALALIVALAGGVSLGPENPVIAIIVGVVVATGTRLLPQVPGQAWLMLAAAGTIGAMFGTAVAAALLFTELVSATKDRPMWDQLFAPLVAAGSGALTMANFEAVDFSLGVTPYTYPEILVADIGLGMLVTLAAVLAGLVLVWLFPISHRFFQSIRHPVAMLTAGGFVLGLLGILGGPITMFKGLAEMKELASATASYTAAGLAAIVVVKLAAVLVSATCGFRGGRIFPLVFVGVAFGLMMHELFPAVHIALAVACAVMGFTLVATRDGWLSLFMAAVMVPGPRLVPLLCLALLPAWLLLAGRPELLIEPAGEAGKEKGQPAKA